MVAQGALNSLVQVRILAGLPTTGGPQGWTETLQVTAVGRDTQTLHQFNAGTLVGQTYGFQPLVRGFEHPYPLHEL